MTNNPIKADLSKFARVMGGDYIQYYAVNNVLSPVAPFGIGGQPLTLDEAKQLYNDLKKQNPCVIYGIDEAKLHISFFTGYEHLHPYNDNQNMAVLPILPATSDTVEMGNNDDPFTGKGGNQ